MKGCDSSFEFPSSKDALPTWSQLVVLKIEENVNIIYIDRRQTILVRKADLRLQLRGSKLVLVVKKKHLSLEKASILSITARVII